MSALDTAALTEKLKRVDELSNADSPEEEPYKEKYEARTVLEEIQVTLKSIATSADVEDMLAFIEYRLGINYSNTEEKGKGAERLQAALSHFEKSERFPYVLLSVLNQLAILKASRHEAAEGRALLERALEHHKKVTESAAGDTLKECPLLPDYSGAEAHESFEDLHTLSLYFMAQVLGAMNDQRGSAQYCLETMKRQLASGKHDPLEWCRNMVGLADYYANAYMPNHAQTVLAAGEAMIKRVKAIGEAGTPSEDDLSDYNLTRAKLDVAWAKVYMVAMECWAGPDRERIVEKPTSEPDLNFPGLEIEAPPRFPDSCPSLAEARKMFKKGETAAIAAKTVFVLDGHVTQHVNLIQLHSRLYRFLAAQDPDPDNKCKMDKRRLDMLLPLADQVSPQHYSQLMLGLYFEIGEVYTDMFFIKEAQNQADPTRHRPVRLNELGIQAIKFFTLFIDLAHPSNDVAKLLDEHVMSAYFAARHAKARIYTRLSTTSVKDELENCKRALAEYNWCVNYFDATADNRLDRDVSAMSRQMAVLMPKKILALQHRAGSLPPQRLTVS